MDARNRLGPQWPATLDRLVREATAAGLTGILDEHDFSPCSEAPDACEPKLIAVRQQIDERYRNASDTVLFELLNEPRATPPPRRGAYWIVAARQRVAVPRREP